MLVLWVMLSWRMSSRAAEMLKNFVRQIRLSRSVVTPPRGVVGIGRRKNGATPTYETSLRQQIVLVSIGVSPYHEMRIVTIRISAIIFRICMRVTAWGMPLVITRSHRVRCRNLIVLPVRVRKRPSGQSRSCRGHIVESRGVLMKG